MFSNSQEKIYLSTAYLTREDQILADSEVSYGFLLLVELQIFKRIAFKFFPLPCDENILSTVKRILHLMCKHYFVKVKNAQLHFMAASFWVQRNMLPQF